MSTLLLKKYEKIIKDNYSIILNEENYKYIILEEFKENKEIKNYFKSYMENNKEKIDYCWAIIMYLFIKSSKDKNVTLVEEYYKKFKKYESNYYIEYVLGDINLMYYGKLFQARDRFLKALNLKENDANIYYNLGFIYNLLGLFSRSLEYYNKAMQFSENSINSREIRLNSLYSVGIYYFNVKKNKEKAEEIFNKILKEDTNNKNVLVTLQKLKGEM